MEVSGIGAGVSAAGGTGATSGAVGASAAGGTVSSASSASASGESPLQVDPNAAPSIPANMQQLMESMRDFSSAEILMALILLKALEGDDDDKKGGSSGAGLALLAGMALAAQLGNMFGGDAAAGVAPVADAGAATGGGLNVTA